MFIYKMFIINTNIVDCSGLYAKSVQIERNR